MYNNKFWSFNGVLSRRQFIVNYLLIHIVKSLILLTPLMYICLFKPDIMQIFLQFNQVLPNWLVIWLLVVKVIELVLLLPSVFRRIQDILKGENPKKAQIITLFTMLMLALNPFFGINLFIILCLFILEGSTKSNKKFNWGAFWGTWIWGVCNKAPKTLFMLPLLFTTAWLPFMLVCGLKGDDWCVQSEDFQKKQVKQGWTFALLFPVFVMSWCIICSMLFEFAFLHLSKNNPDFIQNIKNISEQYQSISIKTTADKIEKKDNIYYFSIEPKIWVKTSDKIKISMFENAVSYVTLSENLMNVDELKVLPQIKFISTFNNEILGEFHLSDSELSSLNKLKGSEAIKIKNSGFRLNRYPSLP